MGKEYRTAQGKALDMQSFVLKNEKVRAVGNVSVNARGDEIDSSGNITRTRDEIMKQHYKNTDKSQTPNQLTPDEDVAAPAEEVKETPNASE